MVSLIHPGTDNNNNDYDDDDYDYDDYDYDDDDGDDNDKGICYHRQALLRLDQFLFVCTHDCNYEGDLIGLT